MFVEHKEQGEVTEAPAKTMKLSNYMRIGARMRPVQSRHCYFDGRGGACAIGAASIALHGNERFVDRMELSKLLNVPMSVLGDCIRRNDAVGQSRETIADWLESQGY